MPSRPREITLLLLVVALFLREILKLRRKKWFIQWLSPKALQTPKIWQMKPKSEKDCPLYQKERANQTESQVCPHNLIPWSEMKKGAEPVPRKGRQTPRKYRQRTPVVAAGVVSRCWTVRELRLYRFWREN